MNKIAICQPYFAPYLGYFQLINAVDVFVSYDDVNFITRGWIHRNKIKVGENEIFITIPLKEQSQHKKINEVAIDWSDRRISKFLKTINMAYNKSRNKEEVLSVLESILSPKPEFISDLAHSSLQAFCNYLNINTQIKTSSKQDYVKTNSRSGNLINICKKENLLHYINPIGGQDLYDKDEFKAQGVLLSFIQGSSSLSIIDVCMNYSKEEIENKLQDYKLI